MSSLDAGRSDVSVSLILNSGDLANGDSEKGMEKRLKDKKMVILMTMVT